jgi:hypothetical protein
MIIEIQLVFIIILIGINTYLLYKLLPTEKQKEVMRKVGKVESDVLEWQPPQTQEEEAFNKVLSDIQQ